MRSSLLTLSAALLSLSLTGGIEAARADDTATHFQQADQAIAQKDWDTAVAELDAVIALEPNNLKAHIGKANILAQPPKSDYRASLAEWDNVIKIDPKSPRAYQMRSAMHNRLGERELARTDMVTFLRLSPEEATKLANAAQQATDGKSWPRALEMWTLFREVRPDDPRGHWGRGKALPEVYAIELFGDPAKNQRAIQARQESLDELETAIKADPKFVPAYLTLSEKLVYLEGAEAKKKAIVVLDRGIQAVPANAELLIARAKLTYDGYLANTEENRKEAIGFYSRAIQLDPNSFEAWKGRAKAYHANHEDNLALPDSERAVALKPNDFEIHKKRAEIYAGLKDYERSVAEYDLAEKVASDVESVGLANDRYWSLIKLPNTDRALKEISEIIESRPTSSIYWRLRADLHFNRKEYAPALADIDKAIELDPKDDAGPKLREQIVTAQKAN